MFCLVWKMAIAAEPRPSCGARCPRVALQVLLLTRVLWGFIRYGNSRRYLLELGLCKVVTRARGFSRQARIKLGESVDMASEPCC